MSRQSDLDNHANQMNPNNDAYWESRGYEGHPDSDDGPGSGKGDKSGDKQSPQPKR